MEDSQFYYEKFGPTVAREYGPKLEKVNDSEQLTELFRLAVRSSRLKEFRDQTKEL